MVEVIKFPKLCRICKAPCRVVKKFSGMWWYECTKDEDHEQREAREDH